MKKNFLIVLAMIPFSLFSGESWENYKGETVKNMEEITGWCSKKKAVAIMNLIKKEKFKKCVEIGVFAGMSLLPIAQALKYNGTGTVFGVDAWDTLEATKGLKEKDPNFTWWSQLDFNNLYNQTVRMIDKHKLSDHCKLIKQPSQIALKEFSDESIDFIHFDGNHSEDQVTEDVKAYFKKVKSDGYILLSDPNWISMRQVLVFLLERTELLSNFSSAEKFMLFRKNAKREKKANKLITH